MQHKFNQSKFAKFSVNAGGMRVKNQKSTLKKVFITIIALTLIAYGIFSDQKKTSAK